MDNPIEIVADDGAIAETLIEAAELSLRIKLFACDGGPDVVECSPGEFEIDVTDASTTPGKLEPVYVPGQFGQPVEFLANRTDMYLKNFRLWFHYEVQQ